MITCSRVPAQTSENRMKGDFLHENKLQSNSLQAIWLHRRRMDGLHGNPPPPRRHPVSTPRLLDGVTRNVVNLIRQSNKIVPCILKVQGTFCYDNFVL